MLGHGGDDLANGGNGQDLVEGGEGHDKLFGGNGLDTLLGDAGNDTLVRGRSDSADMLVGGTGDDVLLGQEGEDWLHGGSGNDRLSGGSQVDVLLGGEGSDTLLGGGGRDTLDGGARDDFLEGAGQADLFVFTGNFGADTIGDFAAGAAAEKIDLSDAFDITDFTALIDNHVTEVGGDTIITAAGGTITLAGVQASQLVAGNFILGAPVTALADAGATASSEPEEAMDAAWLMAVGLVPPEAWADLA